MKGYLVKVCGLTRLEDALLACQLGAWAVGLVFAPSPRQVTLTQAAQLVRGLRDHGLVRRPAGGSPREAPPPGGGGVDGLAAGAPWVVGVFADSSPAEIAQAVLMAGLDGVQLHGEGGPSASAVRAALEGQGGSAFIIQAVAIEVGQEDEARLGQAVNERAEGADLVLLDSHTDKRFGGTGTPFAWESARRAGIDRPFLVAGGIRPDNVRTALLSSGACGVDVSSGLEQAPGVKDPELMRRLFQEVRRMSEEASDLKRGDK